jgi:hypothetical protein
MTRSAESARATFGKAGNVKGSAADALRAALSPPAEPEREMSWLDIATELRRASEAFEAERARALKGSETTEPAEGQPQATTPHTPLNGPGVLRAVLGAIPGATIHGGAS